MKMLAAVRIRGLVNVRPNVKTTLERLMLRRKNWCVLLPDNPTSRGMLKLAQDWIAWGPIKSETVKKLIDKRGEPEGEADIQKIVKGVEEGKSLKELGLKQVFRLSPARGGFKSIKYHYPRGALGKWENIDILIEKMM